LIEIRSDRIINLVEDRHERVGGVPSPICAAQHGS